MPGQRLDRPRVGPRLDIDRPQIPVVDILQGHRHDLRLTVDVDATEELQPKTWGEIFALRFAAALLVPRETGRR